MQHDEVLSDTLPPLGDRSCARHVKQVTLPVIVMLPAIVKLLSDRLNRCILSS